MAGSAEDGSNPGEGSGSGAPLTPAYEGSTDRSGRVQGQEFSPVINIVGRLAMAMGLSALLPALIDILDASPNRGGMVVAALLTMVGGAALAQLTSGGAGGERRGLTRRQAFLLTVLIWLILPMFGALPFILGAPLAGITDAFFESMSGMTTTGASVFIDLDDAPRGMLLWRSMLQWYGGLGIVIVAIVFLPALRIGGMQFFRSEAFDISGETMPRVSQIARELVLIYLALTLACMLGYTGTGMSAFDAICHAMTTVSTGGFATHDSSFMRYPASTQWVATAFMILGALPFLRFIQLARGQPLGLFRDTQVHAFLGIILVASAMMTFWLLGGEQLGLQDAIRETLFNTVSIITGTGYVSTNYWLWGGFPAAIFLILPMIGGCTSSTSCSAKVFRYQILFQALKAQLQRLRSPHVIYTLRYQGRPVEPNVVASVMAFFFVFLASIGVFAILLSLMGLDFITALSASIAALCNVGPGLGELIGPSGSFRELPGLSKWLLAFGMLLGRLEFLSVLVLLTPGFWRH